MTSRSFLANSSLPRLGLADWRSLFTLDFQCSRIRKNSDDGAKRLNSYEFSYKKGNLTALGTDLRGANP
jgi:hypothetical protein